MAEETLTVLRVDGDPASLTLQQLKDSIKKLKDELSKLTIGTEQYQETLVSLTTKQNLLRGAMNGTTASLDGMAKAAAGTETSYNGLVNRMAALNKEFRSLDFNSETGQKRMQELAAEINAVNDQLKSMDALRGNYTRNVGNYRSALNGLNNATAQVVRELPALAISANTFFLAISNNIPILADQIANLRAQNEAAIAKGEKGVNVLTAVVKSFFSWNTVLTLVVTAVTLFGDEIIKFIGNLFKAKDAVDANAEAMKRYREAVEAASKAEGEAIATAKLLYDIATDETRSMKDRLSAVHQLQDEYPDYLGNMSDEAILAGNAKVAYDKLIESLMEYAKTKAYVNKIAEQQGIIIQEEIDTKDAREQLESLRKEIAQVEKQIDDAIPDDIDPRGLKASYYEGATAPLQERLAELKTQANELISLIDESDARAADAQATIEMLRKEINPKYMSTEDNNRTVVKDSEPEDNTLDYIRQLQDAQLALLNDGYEKQLAERRLYYERQIEDLKNTLETEENLTEEGRAAINETIRALTLQGEQESARIMAEWEQSKRDIAQETTEALIKDGEQLSRELDREEQENERRRERELEQTRKWAQEMQDAQLRQIDADKDHAVAMNAADTSMPEGWKAWKEYDIIKEANEAKLELLKQFEQDALKAGDPQTAIQRYGEYKALEVQMEEDAANEKLRIQKAAQQQAEALVGNTTTLLNTLADMYEEDAENNEAAAQKVKNLRIAAATIETLSGAVTAYMQAQQLGPVAGPIVGAVQAALVLATGMAQIQKIRNTDVDKDKEPSSAISATVSAPTVTPNVTQVRNITSASEEDRLNRMADDQRVYILASDIEASQSGRRVRVKESTF